MRANNRSRALAIEVEIAHVELTPRPFQLLARSGVHRARKPEFRVVGNLQRVIVVARFNHRQNRPEDFFLGDSCRRSYISNYGWLNVIAVARLFGSAAA